MRCIRWSIFQVNIIKLLVRRHPRQESLRPSVFGLFGSSEKVSSRMRNSVTINSTCLCQLYFKAHMSRRLQICHKASSLSHRSDNHALNLTAGDTPAWRPFAHAKLVITTKSLSSQASLRSTVVVMAISFTELCYFCGADGNKVIKI